MTATPWSIAAMCMIPSVRTAQEGKYATTAGVIKFAVGQSGSIVFFASITASLPADRYTLRANLERDDPVGPNAFPSLLGTNIRLRQRRMPSGGVENILTIADGQGASLLRGTDGVYTVDGPGKDLNDGVNVETHYYWIQAEITQEAPATAQTRNSVIGIQLV